MANIEKRPFVGKWKLNNRSVVKYTPDALVFLNGDTSLPGCARCRGRIELQNYVTGISVEAGTDPMSHSATISLALPRVQGQQVFIDGYNILRPGLEIHVFMRGYFPIRGMFSHLANSQSGPGGDATPHNTDQFDLTKYATYPYYPVFHGLLTQVSYEYSDGFYHGTLSCTSMLHFWQFVNIATSGAWNQNTVADNSKERTLYGHNFNNTHPFAIIYTLYTDVAGAGAGADFALSQATNRDAITTSTGGGGQQIFDMVSIYWEQRFKTRIQNLRMYGVNGQLFNAAQQAWLGKNRDVDSLLTSSTANDPATTEATRDPFSARLSVAKSLGLQGAGADFTYSPLIQQDNEFFNLSVLDMFAFNQTISEMGAQALWQTTYQTKMDIAQRVMEVTGYEFYQDVDGDLVFKPPFWNLDTAPNRYYRLNDSDIINITFTEKEPRATYIIVRGVWVSGLKDVAEATGVLEKRGFYVDYKLVAKFGWRPAPTLELTYVVDPKVLFWIGVARLDALNVGTFSASATIPIRAELRPGFPVYIPFVDSYYYITQLSHSFSFGGRCTTSLVLTCRRSKWHAPGFLKPHTDVSSAIDLIRLDRPDLPPRPLETFDGDRPRIVGFPNVVMALDPRKLNPNFSVVGIGLDYFATFPPRKAADLLWGLLVRDVHSLNAFAITAGAPGVDNKLVIEDPTQVTQLRLLTSNDEEIYFTIEDLVTSFGGLQTAREPLLNAKTKVKEQSEKVDALEQRVQAFKLAQKAKQAPGVDSSPARNTAKGTLDALEGSLENEKIKFKGHLESSSTSSFLVQLFEALQPESNKPIRRKIDGMPGSDVTLSFFQTLSHLKGQYMASTVPGNYRYFSCSHPDENQQGMPIIQWDDGERSKGPIPSPNTRSGRRSGSRTTVAPGRRGQTQRGARSGFGENTTRFNTEAESLNAFLDVRGVTWIDAQSLLQQRNRGSTTAKIIDGKKGAALKEHVKGTSLKKDVKENLANISQSVQKLINNLDKDPAFAELGFSIKQFSAWRVGATVEGSGNESQHALGKALDLKFANKTSDSDNFQAAFSALKNEASRLYAEGVFNGFGIYEGIKEPFIHVDVREGTAGKWAEVEGIASRRSDKALRESCENNDDVPDSEKEACTLAAIGLRDAALALRDDQFEEGLKLAGVKSKQPLERFPLPLETDPTILSGLGVLVEGGIAVADALATSGPTRPLADPNFVGPLQTPEPFVGPVFVPTPETPPSITTQEISLAVPRLVVQFKSQTKRPGKNRRAPEVILGTGKCRKGLQLAVGAGRAPRVFTTDQIQNISFVRHQAGKFMQVVGVSQNSGGISCNGVALQRLVAEILGQAFQHLDNASDTTVDEIFGEMYTQMSRDLESVGIPTYDPKTGDLLPGGERHISLQPFVSAFVIPAEEVPPSIQDQLSAEGFATDLAEYALADFTLQQLACIPGYTAGGMHKGDDQSWQRTAIAVANAIAVLVVQQIDTGNDVEAIVDENGVPVTGEGQLDNLTNWPGYVKVLRDAQTPPKDRQVRLGIVNAAYNEALGKAFGPVVAQSATESNTRQEKVPDQGKLEEPIHTPVFPVSDEKGYEHYGAYRYGRGLSVDPGGTFEFLHSGKDPFRNVTAQSAEEFLRVMTLAKTGRINTSSAELSGIAKAALETVLAALSVKQSPLETENLSPDVAAQGGTSPTGATVTADAKNAVRKAGLSDVERGQVEQSALDLAATVTGLLKTAQGEDTLRELLRANGDNPDILKAGSFDIVDTQFFRNFVNFAATFGKSPVFKTTAANAAYRLADITSHLLNRAGQACICRGSYADVTMEAYSRENFTTVDGVNTAEEKAEAAMGESASEAETPWKIQQEHYRGGIIEEGGTGRGSAGAGTGGGVVGTTSSPEITTSANSVTENPEDRPPPEENSNDEGFHSTEAAEAALGSLQNSADEITALENVLGVPSGGLFTILETQGPAGIRALVATREAQGDLESSESQVLFEEDGDPLRYQYGEDQGEVRTTENVAQGLGFTADQVLALLYLQSQQQQEPVYGPDGELTPLNEPPTGNSSLEEDI